MSKGGGGCVVMIGGYGVWAVAENERGQVVVGGRRRKKKGRERNVKVDK